MSSQSETKHTTTTNSLLPLSPIRTHLQSLSTQLPSPPSPTSSTLSSLTNPSTSTNPTSIPQILTAHMLLVLLSSPPNHSLPFPKLKEVLGAKADALIALVGTGAMAGIGLGSAGVSTGGVGIAGQVVQRWGVAKRLLKVERGGGQQVVRFNV